MRILLTKGFLVAFKSGVVVIRHWKINNTLKNDRYHPTMYQAEMSMLAADENGMYLLPEQSWNQVGTNMEPEHNITELNPTEQNRGIGAASPQHTKPSSLKKPEVSHSRFVPPTLEEVREYARERNSKVDPDRFFDFYTSKGWKVGKDPMKDFKAAFRNWERNEAGRAGKDTTDISRPDVYECEEGECL